MKLIHLLFDARSSKAGFTLLEMVIVLAILSFGFIPLITMFSSGIVASKDATDNMIAVQLAQQKMEQVKGLAFASIAGTSEACGEIPGYPSFSRTVSVASAEGSASLAHVSVMVQWASGSTVNDYGIDTLITNY